MGRHFWRLVDGKRKVRALHGKRSVFSDELPVGHTVPKQVRDYYYVHIFTAADDGVD